MRCMQQFKDFLKTNQVEYTDADIAGVSDWLKAEHQERAVHLAVRATGRPEGAR